MFCRVIGASLLAVWFVLSGVVFSESVGFIEKHTFQTCRLLSATLSFRFIRLESVLRRIPKERFSALQPLSFLPHLNIKIR